MLFDSEKKEITNASETKNMLLNTNNETRESAEFGLSLVRCSIISFSLPHKAMLIY